MSALGQQINRWIASTHPNAPLAGQGEMLVRVGRRYGVDPRVLAIIARKESQFGIGSGRFRNNAWGWGVHLGPEVNTSRTWEEGATKVAKGLAGSLYKGAGLTTPSQIIMRYAPPSENNTRLYIDQISGWMREMGGDPSASVFGAPSSVPEPPGTSSVERQYGQATQGVPAAVDGTRLMTLLRRQSERALRGEMPETGFMDALTRLARGAASRQPQAAPDEAAPPVAGLPTWTVGGTPKAGTHSLGNWQSDMAYDFMGRAGDPVVAGVSGRVVKVSGSPGGNPRFAGYGITVQVPGGGQLFYKHLGSSNVRVGQTIRAGQVIGTLDGSTQGGAHLHLGATHRQLLDRQRDFYTRAGSAAQQGAPSPGGSWNGTYEPAMGMARIAKRHGLSISSSKRDRQSTASGGVSDHWSGSTSSYAVDLAWGGERPTDSSDRAASEIVAALGGPRDWGRTGGNFVVTRNGLRWQVIYRSDVGGNHWNHIHVGVKRA